MNAASKNARSKSTPSKNTASTGAATPTDAATIDLEVGPPAHGGHCVARLDGRVVFVRHALPGEHVRAVVTSTGSKFWRADAVEVLGDPSPDRVASAWPAAGPGGVGGGELAHVSLPGQRAWKAAVVAEQLRRMARVELEVPVLPAPGDDERGGLAYRTRIDLVTGPDGRAGMFGWRSHEVHVLDAMPLAVEQITDLDLFSRRWPARSRIAVAAPATDRPLLMVDGEVWDLARHRRDQRGTPRRSVREQVGRFEYRVAADGFWQAHRAAPQVLVDAVLGAAGDVTGATVADLYAGAGLFTVALADAVGEQGRVVAVEGDARAVRDARRNAHDLPQVQLLAGDVRDVVSADALVHADVVVLDPPRAGAGRVVVDRIGELRPERVVYVACDPAALARDVDLLAAHGYRLVEATGHDLFPMTHHVETVAVLTR